MLTVIDFLTEIMSVYINNVAIITFSHKKRYCNIYCLSKTFPLNLKKWNLSNS